MRRNNHLNVLIISVCVFVLICTLGKGIEPGNTADVDLRDSVVRALRHSAESHAARDEVRLMLEEMPAESAIPAVIYALTDKEISQRGDSREIAYRILSHHNAASADEGLAQLSRGLSDPSARIRRICCAALPAARLEVESDRIRAVLQGKEASETEKRAVLVRIAGWGPFAESMIGTAEAMLADQGLSENTRSAAARAILNIGDFGPVLKTFADLDDGGLEVSILELTRFLMGKARDSRTAPIPAYEEQRTLGRVFIIEEMGNPAHEVRSEALTALVRLYPMDWVIFQSPQAYDWNHKMLTAVEAMAKSDPNPDLRSRAETLFRDFMERGVDAVAQSILDERDRNRRRQAHQKQVIGASDN